MPKIVAIAGSPSHPSRSYSVLEHANTILRAESVSSILLSVRDLPADALLFAQFDHPQIKEAIAQIAEADAIILSTPVYKAAYTGVLKAFLDLLPQTALVGKPVLPIVTGGTIAHLLAIDYTIKPVLSALGARYILGGVYIVDTQIQRQENGDIQIEEEVEHRLNNAVYELISAVRPIATQPAAVS